MIYSVWFILAGEAHWIGRAADPSTVAAIVVEYSRFPEYRGADVRIVSEGGAK
jgi:hypothetical protein